MQELDAQLPVWGFSGSPLVVSGNVIVYVGGRDDFGLVAFDSETGDTKWSVDGNGMNFSSAQLEMIDGVETVLFTTEVGLLGIDANSGKTLWSHTPADWNAVPMVQPQIIGDNSFVVALGDGIGICRLEVARDEANWRVSESWSSRDLKPSFNDFVYHDGYLYGFDQNIFACVDATTGKRMWKRGRYGFGQVLMLTESNALLVLSEKGEVVVLAADPSKHRELAKMQVIEGKTWNHPVTVGDLLFVRNGQEVACFRLPMSAEDGTADTL